MSNRHFLFSSPAEQPSQPHETLRPYVGPRFAKSYRITHAGVSVIFCTGHQPSDVNPNMSWAEYIGLLMVAGPCPNCRAGYTVEGEECSLDVGP